MAHSAHSTVLTATAAGGLAFFLRLNAGYHDKCNYCREYESHYNSADVFKQEIYNRHLFTAFSDYFSIRGSAAFCIKRKLRSLGIRLHEHI